LAKRIGTSASNVAFWELSGTPPRGEVLPGLARELGVSVDALLGVTPQKPAIAKGRLQEAFHAAAKLPRRQQQKIVEVVEALLKAG
jgi:transcriptional regulator with XRE-family HTH domain